MATPQEQRRLLQEQRQRLQQKAQQNKPPAIGTKRADGKIYSGQNYGFQSPATYDKLKEQGKFRAGTQAIDRASQAVSRLVPKPVKQYAAAVAADQQRQAARQDRQIRNTAGNSVANAAQNNATGRTLDAASKALNVDRRVVGAAAGLAQAAISRKALKGGKPTAGTPNRSVGAAARADVAGRTAPATRQLPKVNRPSTVHATPARQATVKKTGVNGRMVVDRSTQTQSQLRKAAKNRPRPGARSVTPEGKSRAATSAREVQRDDVRYPNTPAKNAQGVLSENQRAIRNTSFKDGQRSHKNTTTGYQTITKDKGDNTRELIFTSPARRGGGQTFDRSLAKPATNLGKAGLKDSLGREFRDVPVGGRVKADSWSSDGGRGGRNAAYARATKKALHNPDGGELSATREGSNRWRNDITGEYVKFDPKDLSKDLQRLARPSAKVSEGRRLPGTGGAKSNKRLPTTANTVPVDKGTRAALRRQPVKATRNHSAVRPARTQSADAARRRIDQMRGIAQPPAAAPGRSIAEQYRAQRAQEAQAPQLPRAARTSNGNTIRERQGVVRSNQRSRVSADQRQRTRASTSDQKWDNSQNRQRTPAEQAAARRFTDQRAGGREVDRGGRRTWNGSNETRRLRIRRR